MTGGAPPGPARTGWGFDAHRLGGQPPLILGGVVVSDDMGVIATSDGDVLAHAVTDAVLGAAVLGDMGDHFPSDDSSYAGTSSMGLLRRAVAGAHSAGWRVDHVDATVVAEEVRVAPHRAQIRSGLAGALDVASDRVSVKATTTDGLGMIGEGEGIAAMAVVTVVPR